MDTSTAADQQVARDVSREFNANRPRRSTANYSGHVASRQSSQEATRVAKRIRLSQSDGSLISDSPKLSLIVKLKINNKDILQSPAFNKPADINGSADASSPAHASGSSATSDSFSASDSAYASGSPGPSDSPDASRPTRASCSAKAKPRAKAAPKPYHENVQAKNETLPFGQPPAWAAKRQPLCETLPWYRAYQSGLYQHNGIALGFMVDKEVTPRDVFTEEIMIASW